MAVAQIKATFQLPNFPYKLVFGTVTMDSSYPTGGETALDLSTELDEVLGVHFDVQSTKVAGGTTAAVFRYDVSTKKIMAYGGAAANTELTEFTATKNLSAFVQVGFIAWGFKS